MKNYRQNYYVSFVQVENQIAYCKLHIANCKLQFKFELTIAHSKVCLIVLIKN